MTDIFISYAREDRGTARLLNLALESKGWTVWWDQGLLAGQNFDDEIQQALDEADCVIVLWSKRAVKSHWVKDEANEGRRRGILVPALVEQTPIPLGFRGIHTESLIGWHGEREHPGLLRLEQAVEAVLTRRTISTPPQEPQRPVGGSAEKATPRKNGSKKSTSAGEDEPSETAPRRRLAVSRALSTPRRQRSATVWMGRAIAVAAVALLLGALWFRFQIGNSTTSGGNQPDSEATANSSRGSDKESAQEKTPEPIELPSSSPGEETAAAAQDAIRLQDLSFNPYFRPPAEKKETENGPEKQGLSIESLKLQGIFALEDGFVAQAESPDGDRSFLLTAGDKLRDGKVVAIDRDRVTFELGAEDSNGEARRVVKQLPGSEH